MSETTYADLDAIVEHFRNNILENKKYILLYAYNGVGKTRLSMAFKDAGKNEDERDTLYFNAFTEDLFSWDNDLENDSYKTLDLNTDSRFFSGLKELEMESRIRPLLSRYANFDFTINYDGGYIEFKRDVIENGSSTTIEDIKISRGEENIFIWCFFLAVAQLAIDGQEAYNWVKYIYVDDPISSLDDNNAIAVASHLAQLIKSSGDDKKIVISSHHTLFFSVMYNELKRERDAQRRPLFKPFFLSKDSNTNQYILKCTGDIPFYHHVAMLKELKEAADSDKLYTYHFNILRGILEKTATFHGFKHFSSCIQNIEPDDPEATVHSRIINVLSHGDYSLFEPAEMVGENKEYFKRILNDFMNNYKFNPKLFSGTN